jgi:hypothetical protein
VSFADCFSSFHSFTRAARTPPSLHPNACTCTVMPHTHTLLAGRAHAHVVAGSGLLRASGQPAAGGCVTRTCGRDMTPVRVSLCLCPHHIVELAGTTRGRTRPRGMPGRRLCCASLQVCRQTTATCTSKLQSYTMCRCKYVPIVLIRPPSLLHIVPRSPRSPLQGSWIQSFPDDARDPTHGFSYRALRPSY